MDIIIEGNLTSDEGVNDLLETIIHLKSVPNALLRISSKEENIKGRIGFGPGGYILGGCIDDTGELGYTAIKKLLTIKSGNYAVLDTGHEHPAEVNQTLWIKGDKILQIWPNLPETADQLLDVNGNLLSVLPSSSSQNIITKDERVNSISRIRSTAIEIEKKQPHRKRNIAITLSSILLMLLLLLMLVMFGNQILSPPHRTIIPGTPPTLKPSTSHKALSHSKEEK